MRNNHVLTKGDGVVKFGMRVSVDAVELVQPTGDGLEPNVIDD